MPAQPVVLTELSCRALSVATADPFTIATGTVHATRSVLCQVTLQRGTQRQLGLGEGACLPPVTQEDQPDALAAVLGARGALVGAQFSSTGALLELLDAALASTPVARSAVEVAVLDAWARLDDAPLWRWLGGSTPRELESDITIPMLAPERMAELAAQWWARGFRALKVKVGRDLDADARALEAVHRVTPQARFRLDANCGLSVADAVKFTKHAARWALNVECFEQPCATLEELAEVAAQVSVPVLADESVKSMAQLRLALGHRALGGVNLKVVKSGSLVRAREIGVAALQAGWSLMVGGMVETRLGMTAAAHLATSLERVAYADLDTAWLLTEEPFSGGYQAQGATLSLGEAAGLGVAPRAA